MFQLMKSITAIAASAATACASAFAAPMIISDIAFIIDDSVSMRGDIEQVKARIVEFNQAMIDAGIAANYGLVSFGGPSGAGGGCNPIVKLQQDVTSFADFNRAGGPFQTLEAPCSTREPGSEATAFALQNLNFRTNSVINVILITDEDDDSSAADFALADTELTAADALFNFIGRPGVGNTNNRYGVLAADHGGQAFDILSFRRDPEPFFQNFVATKVQEILDVCIQNPTLPECQGDPGTDVSEPSLPLGLFGLGLIGYAFYRCRAAL